MGADASNDRALKTLYTVKGRPSAHPVIVHLASVEQMTDWSIDLSDQAKKLAKHFWPGPLTLIVKKSPQVSYLVTGGQDTVGLRVPNHPIALALLNTFGGGIAAPSANKYGRISSTCAQHVRDEFGNEIKLVLDGGNCSVGIESTIVDTTSAIPRILRPGMISESEIFKYLGITNTADINNQQNIRVPGSDKTHYAPKTPMLLLDKDALSLTLARAAPDMLFAILAFNKFDLKINHRTKNMLRQFIEAPSDPKLYAHTLYENLRQLDNSGATHILIEQVPTSYQWSAMADRLKRASYQITNSALSFNDLHPNESQSCH